MTRRAHADPSNTQTPGDRIRALRIRLKLTLADVSARTGLAVSTLSKLELGKASLSYEKLSTISRGLGVDMAQVLEPSASPLMQAGRSPGRRIVHRQGEGRVVETRSYRQLYLATELLHKRFMPLMADVRARTIEDFLEEFGALIRHPGEEFCLILEGEVDFHTELYAPIRLRVGDSVYFDSDMGHAYLAACDTRCRVISICAGPSGDTSMLDGFVEVSAAHAGAGNDLATPAAGGSIATTAPRSSAPARPARGRRAAKRV